MRLLDRLLPWRKSGAVTTLDIMREVFGLDSKAGARINLETALQVATVLACVRVLADGVAQVPLKLYRGTGRDRREASDHPLYQVLHRRPCEWMTSYEYRETMMMHVVLAGYHVAYINRVRGQVRELIPFHPSQVRITRPVGTMRTKYEVIGDNGEYREIPEADIWHLRGPSWNTWSALSPVRLARDSIGLASAIEEQQSGFYARGASPSGGYSVEGKLSQEEHEKLKKWIEREVAGSANAARVLVLDRAAKWQQYSMSATDAQTLEQRRFQIEEICRAFRVMPIMVGHADKVATYASAEQMFLAHVVHTLAPWYERIEQSIDAHLMTDADRREGLYCKFVEEGLLRGSLKDTKDFLLGLTNGGLITPNEARDKLDMQPDADPASDRLRIPANITGAAQADPNNAFPAPEPGQE